MLDKDLIRANEDIMAISKIAVSIGWGSVSKQTICRVIYLVQVLYSFKHEGEQNLFDYYHFSATTFGPYTNLLERAIVYLRLNGMLKDDGQGGLALAIHEETPIDEDKRSWLKTVMLMLGKYGERFVFSFIINDPAYENAIKTNNVTGVDTMSNNNETLKTLRDFRNAFEQTLEDTSKLKDEKYIELYFDYVFGQIIKS